jgi:hypothetical protein
MEGVLKMQPKNFEAFQQQKLSEGYDQALIRNWEPNQVNEAHTHPFDTDAVVVQGEFVLTRHGQSRTYKVGDSFQVLRGEMHSEQYGPEGAVFWAARKN